MDVNMLYNIILLQQLKQQTTSQNIPWRGYRCFLCSRKWHLSPLNFKSSKGLIFSPNFLDGEAACGHWHTALAVTFNVHSRFCPESRALSMTSIQTPPTGPPSMQLHWLRVLGFHRKHEAVEDKTADWSTNPPVSLHKDVIRLTWKTTSSDGMRDVWANQ